MAPSPPPRRRSGVGRRDLAGRPAGAQRRQRACRAGLARCRWLASDVAPRAQGPGERCRFQLRRRACRERGRRRRGHRVEPRRSAPGGEAGPWGCGSAPSASAPTARVCSAPGRMGSSASGGRIAWRDPVAELVADGEDINAAAFSPDGRRVVAGLADGTVRVWNASGGNAKVLRGHVGQVTAVAFNRDGSLIASGGGDGQVRIWNGATGRPIVVTRAASWRRRRERRFHQRWLGAERRPRSHHPDLRMRGLRLARGHRCLGSCAAGQVSSPGISSAGPRGLHRECGGTASGVERHAHRRLRHGFRICEVLAVESLAACGILRWRFVRWSTQMTVPGKSPSSYRCGCGGCRRC